jgi:hypothetical protein
MTKRSALLGVALCAAALNIITVPHAQAEEAAAQTDPTGTEEQTPEGSDPVLDKKRANARKLATDASNDYRMGRFQDAYDNFNRAFKLVGVPALGVWSARSLRQMDRLVEASERYREVLKAGTSPDNPESYQSALADARAELDELLPLIPHLKISLENARPEDVEVNIDGELVDPALIGARQQVNPGSRKVTATRAGEVVEREIRLAEGDNREIVLTFRPGYKALTLDEPSTEATRPQQGFTPLQVVGIVAMSGGGALLATGIVTTVIGLGQQEKLRQNCTGGACPPEFHSDVNNFNTMKLVSTASLIGGAALGGIGAAIYFSGKPKEEKGVALLVTGNTVGLCGEF